MNTRPTTTLARLALLPAAVVLAAVLAGCGSDIERSTAPVTSESGTPTAAATPAPSSTTPSSDAPSAPAAAGTPITLEIDGHQVSGELDSSATSESLIAQLPLTLSFRDYGGQEKVAELPSALSLDGAPEHSDADPLAIGYYSPDQRLVLYYDHVGDFAGIVPIGSFDDLDAVHDQTNDFTVTIRPAN